MNTQGFLIAVGLAVTFAPGAVAQPYKPLPGETVLQVEVEARGNVYVKLHTNTAPKACAQVSKLASRGFYDGQRFFRVIRSPKPFLIQLGDPASRDASKLDDSAMGSGGSGARIPYEDSGYAHEAGAVGLATQQHDRDAGDSQFYILMSASRFLDGNYTVFGKVVAGWDVVQKIQKGDLVVSVKVLTGK